MSTLASACFNASRGLVNSDSSKPSATRIATRLFSISVFSSGNKFFSYHEISMPELRSLGVLLSGIFTGKGGNVL